MNHSEVATDELSKVGSYLCTGNIVKDAPDSNLQVLCSPEPSNWLSHCAIPNMGSFSPLEYFSINFWVT